MQRIVAAMCAGMLIALGAHAQQGPLELGAGLHYNSGDYGTDTTTKITTLEATARYETGSWVYRANVPWLKVEGDQTVIPGVGRPHGRGPATTTTSTESGLGDILLAATYNAYYDKASTFGLDFTGKVKLPTADEEKGLGTGEVDFIFLVDVYRTFDRTTWFGGIGYHVLGDAPGLPLENVLSMNFGASYKIDQRDSAGVSFYARERAAPSLEPQRELMGFFVRKFDNLWKAQLYALIGLADGSPDWGFGLSLARPF